MIECVKRVANIAGLFETRHMRAYDEDFDLLCYPDCQKETVCFDYSYFEGAQYEKITVNCRTGDIHSGYTGFKQFGAAVRALAVLAKSYSNSFFCNDNWVGSKEMRWLSYVLDKPLTLPCHTTIWDVYERYVRDNGVNQTISAMDFLNSYEGDETNIDEITTIVYVNDVISDDYVEKCVNDQESTDRASYAFWVRSMARFLWLAKQNSEKSESELLDRYMRLLHNVSNIRAQIAAGVDVSPVKELFATVAPPITVKLIATIYDLDFWQLWSDNKNEIGVTSSIFYDESTEYITVDETSHLEPITTEEYFDVAPEDRLYWWKEDGDVIISDKTHRWLKDMAEQHRTHVATMDVEFSAIEWHERLVKFLGKHKDKIKMFEHLYCDFLNSFHRKAYRAWIEMLEALGENDADECRKLIAVLSNEDHQFPSFREIKKVNYYPKGVKW